MTRGQWSVSVFVVAFVAFKLTEGLLPLESWPLSHIPMFSARRPAHVNPIRFTLLGTTGGPWFELGPSRFNLSEDELLRRQYAGLRTRTFSAQCGRLGQLYNASQRLAGSRLTALRARLEKVKRPGVPMPPQEIDIPLSAGASPRRWLTWEAECSPPGGATGSRPRR